MWTDAELIIIQDDSHWWDHDEEQIAKENFIHKGGGNDESTKGDDE